MENDEFKEVITLWLVESTTNGFIKFRSESESEAREYHRIHGGTLFSKKYTVTSMSQKRRLLYLVSSREREIY